MYTNNWYTGVKLCKEFFEKYGWAVIGTISPLEKKSRANYDIPFLNMSNGTRLGVERG